MEAKDSSEIENIVTTSDKLFQFAQESTFADAATKEALRYRTALYEGYKQLAVRPLCTNTAIDICSTIKSVRIDIRKVPATVLSNQQTGETIYTPPVGESALRDLLGSWDCSWMRKKRFIGISLIGWPKKVDRYRDPLFSHQKQTRMAEVEVIRAKLIEAEDSIEKLGSSTLTPEKHLEKFKTQARKNGLL